MALVGISETFEKITASFLGNSSEYSPVAPEVTQTISEIVLEHRDQISVSVNQTIPTAIEDMVSEGPRRESQVTGITTESDVIGRGVKIAYDKPLNVDVNTQLMEDVLRGADPSVLLRNEKHIGNVVSIADRLPADPKTAPETEQVAEVVDIEELQRRAIRLATSSMPIDPNDPEVVNAVVHTAAA